jgi:uncharacterized DUF497 family protein
MKYSKKLVLTWDEWSIEHIKKHNVTITEVRQAVKLRKIVDLSYKNRLEIIGKTKKGRLLDIILSYELQKEAYIVTARDCSKKEREKFQTA